MKKILILLAFTATMACKTKRSRGKKQTGTREAKTSKREK